MDFYTWAAEGKPKSPGAGGAPKSAAAKGAEALVFKQKPEDIVMEPPPVAASEAAKRAGLLAETKAATTTGPLRSRLAAAEALPYAEEAAAAGEAAAPSMGEGLGRFQPPTPPSERLPDAVKTLNEHFARNAARAKSLQAQIATAETMLRQAQVASSEGPSAQFAEAGERQSTAGEIERMKDELRRLDAAQSRLKPLRDQWAAAAGR